MAAPPDRQAERADAPRPGPPGMFDARSLVFKFLVRILPLLVVGTLTLMLVVGNFTRHDAMTKIDTDVGVFATATSRVLDGLLWNYQTEEMVSALATISSNPAMLGAEIYDEKGDLFLSYGITPEDRVDGLKTVWRDIYRRMPDGTRADMGRLAIHYTHTFAERRFRQEFLWQMISYLAIIAVTLAGAVFAFHRTVSRPLDALLAAIRTTGETGRWTEADWRSDDEIGEVIEAHNATLRHIAAKEAALADSEKRYRQLFENALVGIYLIAPDGMVIEGNRTVADIMGYPSTGSMVRVSALNHYVHPEDRNRLWELLRRDGEVSRFRLQLRRLDDTRLWAELSGRLTPEGFFNGIMQDVTDQVAAERAMAERDELHRAFFEENKAVMILHDPLDSTIQFVNPAACRYYGYSNEELTSMTIRQLDCMSDDQMYRELKAASEERRNYFKHVHTLKDGTRRDVEVFTGPVSLGRRQLHYSIVHDVTEKRRLEARLERMATRDQLTGAYNRHAFFQRARHELARARRFNRPLAVLMCDLDHFKEVNDSHGHAIGDEVLRTFALRCRADSRKTDVFARMGGEEFAALLVETDAERAVEVAERIRAMTASKPVSTEVGDMAVTVSIGVAALNAEDSINELLKRADEALYKAKESGRNSVVLR
ncbi:diguanylate cyclase with PAS/PAC sensor [Pseudodesulfovibrio mercurii]|uniref:Diguanylate cyclase with PAS/PAC sensor n=1 Tax=Pseudodesulfovibrio mercurii TaxID=641491 RepID=F0JKJ2_9BACT|nr:diguanylate cyclase [Pseudodesulfovibrio mercurii]EGB16441.1 diguanylate cyclase with PAS/PAC sensor [Pseudodesulfovibrio mercurii]